MKFASVEDALACQNTSFLRCVTGETLHDNVFLDTTGCL